MKVTVYRIYDSLVESAPQTALDMYMRLCGDDIKTALPAIKKYYDVYNELMEYCTEYDEDGRERLSETGLLPEDTARHNAAYSDAMAAIMSATGENRSQAYCTLVFFEKIYRSKSKK